jgi:hypothetical protein
LSDEERAKLGPLGALIGTWEGDEGKDVAPADDRGIERNDFRERMTFVPTGLVENHEQQLYGLRYATTAWRLGESDPFHEEVGYWLWDGGAQQVMRCFIVPRGVVVNAGGTAAADASTFQMAADVGSEIFGICSNPFLDREFKTVRYELTVEIEADGRFRYREDTQLRLAGKDDIFHHTDENTLRRVSTT